MNILITGATGLIGTKLVEKLLEHNFNIRVLTRDKSKVNSLPSSVDLFDWNPSKEEIEAKALDGVDCIINLAGSSINAGRWNDADKKLIISSRLDSTNFLVKLINQLDTPPSKLINASAIGFYGNRGDEKIDESSTRGEGFLSDVCFEWEECLKNIQKEECDVKVLRIGLVLAKDGGILKELLPIFSLGLGGNISSGEHYMSWIHIDDLVHQFIALIQNDYPEKIFNGTSPRPVSNYIFTSTLAKVLKRPAFLHVPKFALKLALGKKSDLVLEGQKVIPNSFLKYEFDYKYRTLKSAFKDILQKRT